MKSLKTRHTLSSQVQSSFGHHGIHFSDPEATVDQEMKNSLRYEKAGHDDVWNLREEIDGDELANFWNTVNVTDSKNV